MNTFLKPLDYLIVGLGWLARAAVLVLVLLVATNVLMRYVFSWSPVGLQELEWHLISPIALLGMAYTVHHRGDVRVDFIYDTFSARKRAMVDVLSGLLTIAIGVFIAKLALPYVLHSYGMGEGSPDPGGLDHRFLLKAFLPLGFSLLAIQGLLDTLRATRRLIDNELPAAPAHHASPEVQP